MPPADRLRLTELLASLSLATDLGTGQPLGHGLRTCLLAVRLTQAMDHGPDVVRSVQQVSLLRFLGCTADSAEVARLAGGDDLTFNVEMAPALNGREVESLPRLFKAVGPGRPALEKSRMVLAAVVGADGPASGLAAHCEVAAMLAHRLRVDEEVVAALGHAYERWDGKGYPAGVAGEDVSLEIRIASVARDVDMFRHRGDDVAGVLAKRRDKAYDPAVVDAFMGLDEAPADAEWETVLEVEPEPWARVRDLDAALGALADFVDLKSPWTRGHSPRVAELAAAAALEAGLGDETSESLRRAGLVHDLGRVGVENGIWDRPAALGTTDWEKVRLHPYLTQRILARCSQLAPVAELAASHHERLDGSGYHRELAAGHLSLEQQILAAADMLAALTAGRPHRPALDLDDAIDVLRAEADGGRIEMRAVQCVASAAGARTEPSRPQHPAGLSGREVEVLGLLARGMTNRQVAEELFISVKTVGRHVENIYAKIGVSTRAGAALFAMEHRLLG